MGIDIGALKAIAIENLSGSLGHLTKGADPITREAALRELDGFLDRNGEALSAASIDFALDLIRQTASGSDDVAEILERVEEMDAEELAALAEGVAADVVALSEGIIEGRRKLLADVKATLSGLARAALAAALAGLSAKI